jgi:arylsulfatase A-like enzyme
MNPNHLAAAFLMGMTTAAAPAWAQEPVRGNQPRPNIVFLFSDDHRWDAMGFMSDGAIKTPQMDRLAADGVVFQNAFHASPICLPARAGVMLSQYEGTHMAGFDRPTNFTVSRAEFANSYPLLLRGAGYRTAFVGKFGFAVSDDKIPQDHMAQDSQEQRDFREQLWLLDEYMPSDAFDAWYGFSAQGRYFPEGQRGRHLTRIMTDQAIEFMRASVEGDQPFAVSVFFKAPHAPYMPDPAFADLYPPGEVPVVPNYRTRPDPVLPEAIRRFWRGRGGVPETQYQDVAGRYFRLVYGIDVAIGRIREELQRLGIADNTIIIYASDNGYFLGSKGLKGKDLLYEESLRMPLLVLDPRVAAEHRRGRRIRELVSSLDLAPTMLELAGVTIPKVMQGRSLVPLLQGQTPEDWRDTIFAENYFSSFYLPAWEFAGDLRPMVEQRSARSRCVRSDRYKYLIYYELRPVVEQLFDLERDPHETLDLSGDPAYAKVLEEMRVACQAYVSTLQVTSVLQAAQ